MRGMKYVKAKILDKKSETKRFRNILAASGEVLESGDIRDVRNMYVMGRDGKLIKIAELNTNPDKQTEEYSVKAQADHGEVNDWGEPISTIEKVFGHCKVWLEDDGLHARMYFAEGDELADHAYAISEEASYSIGFDIYADGYDGANNAVDGEVGILREISMVVTGNDPRAKTIDHKAIATGSKGAADANGNNKLKKGISMPKELKDKLTAEDAESLKATINAAIDGAVEGSEDEPENNKPADDASKANDTNDNAEGDEAKTDKAPATTSKKDTLHANVVVIKDRADVKQERGGSARDWLHGAESHRKFADMLRSHGRMDSAFVDKWRDEVAKHMTLDGITGLPSPAPVAQYFAEAIEKSSGIISHVDFVSSKSLRLHFLAPASDGSERGKGHKKSEKKANNEYKNFDRDLLTKMVYTRLDLDALEIYENPELIDFRAKQLVDQIVREIERAIVVGDGRANNDKKAMFDGTRGFYSIKADAAENGAAEYGKFSATEITMKDGENLYDAVVRAKGLIRTEGEQFLVASSEEISKFRIAKGSDGHYIVAPGTKVEDVLEVSDVYKPKFMDDDDAVAYLIVNKAYKMIGEGQVRVRTDFDTTDNTDIMLDETPRGGSLGEYMCAVAIKAHTTSA